MSNKKKMQHWETMYALPLEKIPWEITMPPKELVALVERGLLPAGKALDVACGTGNYAFYLAQNDCEVIGVDFSQNALDIAVSRNKKFQLPVTFLHGDITDIKKVLGKQTFDFILDYSILHHIAPEDVVFYAKQFEKLLNPQGKLLLVCYSEKDEYAHGEKKAKGKYGNDMFYRTRGEIESLYSNLH